MPTWQRLDDRYVVALRADCVTRDTFVRHWVTNISRGGVFLQGTSLPVDSELQLRLHLDHDVVPVRARVVWNKELERGSPRYVHGMGMKFVDLEAEAARRLNAFLKRIAPPSSPDPPTSH